MPAPYYVGDEVPLQFDAKDSGGSAPSTAPTVDVYDPANTKVVDGATSTLASTTVTYNVAETITTTGGAGTYRAVFTVIFMGTITRQHTIQFFVRDPTLRFSVYGSVAGVESKIGDMVSSRTFTDTTVPSFQEIQELVDGVAHELNMELLQQGYQVPVRGADDPIAYQHLVYVNNCGAAARALSTLPMESYVFPDNEGAGGDRRTMWDRELWHAIQRIRKQEFKATTTTSPSDNFIAGSRTDRDTGEVKNPLFKRNMTDFPGTRVLQE